MLHEFKKSAHVAGFDYDEDTRQVTVHFRNGLKYTRANVPDEAIKNWILYRSPGEFYHAMIKRYPIVKENTNGAS